MQKLLNKVSCFGSRVGDSHVDPLSNDAESVTRHDAKGGGEAQRGAVAAQLQLHRLAVSMRLRCTALNHSLHFQAR